MCTRYYHVPLQVWLYPSKDIYTTCGDDAVWRQTGDYLFINPSLPENNFRYVAIYLVRLIFPDYFEKTEVHQEERGFSEEQLDKRKDRAVRSVLHLILVGI